MRIVNKSNSIKEIYDLILSKAKYQKVIFCIDETSDVQNIDNIINMLGRKVIAIKYYYNHKTVSTFFNMLNNGVRIVVYNIKIEHFYKLQTDSNFVLNIFIPQENFMLPYMSNVESLYGDNILICHNQLKDNLSVLFMYYQGLNKVWGDLLQRNQVDMLPLKKIDLLTRCNSNFYVELLDVFKSFGCKAESGYKEVEFAELPSYVYLQVCAMLKLFQSFSDGVEKYIDFEKEGFTSKDVCKAYDLIAKHDIIDIIKFNNHNLIKLTNVILNRLKILIKKYFKLNGAELIKINKLIKTQAKRYNIDDLLYISYIFDII